jgi:excisionase family DNA binding protein
MSKKKPKKFLTIKDVAEKLDISQRSVNRYIEAKKLKATKIGFWRITAQDLQDFVKRSSNLRK